MNKITYTLLLLMISITDSYAQTTIALDVPRVVPISPTATAMEKYQSYPVDHSTGIPNITIPLYEIVAGEVSLPVSLSYHSSGLKPKDASTYAGTGWTLNLEPSVTRQICGLADDFSYGWLNDPNRDYNPPNTGDPAIANPIIIDYYNQLIDNIRDTQPDKFSYKLANGSGSGYFPDGTNFLSIPRNNDKVEYHSANGMLIKDARGVKYLFDGESEKVEDNITRWMCKSIWSPNNPNHALVDFSYTMSPHNPSLNHYYNLNDHVIISRSENNFKNIFTVQNNGSNNHYSIEPVQNSPDAHLRYILESEAGIYYPGTSRHISGIMARARLNKVNFLGNKMFVSYKSIGSDLFYSEVLDDIKVFDQNGILVRSIKLYITHYNSSTSLTKLDSLVISAPGVETRKYIFNYNNPQYVPPNSTKAVDHWGFCNGDDYSGGSTVPSFQRAITYPNVSGGPAGIMMLNFSGTSREPNYDWTKTGVLSGITDPQGISTTFTYEGNFGAFRDNSKSNNKDYLYPVGGLRIRRIQTLDPGTGKKNFKYYTYGLTRPEMAGFKPVWGGGAIRHIVTLRDYTSSSIQRDRDSNGSTHLSYLTTYSSMPESNISFNGGSSVMYNIVTEEVASSADSEILKTNYYYNVKMHNFEDVLHWDDADPAGSVKTFLREQPETVLQQIARVSPAHPREPSDDYVHHFAATNQLYGRLIRKESFRNNKLASKTEYIYKKEAAWGGEIALDLPHRLITGNTEGLAVNDVIVKEKNNLSGSSPQTTYYLDTETYVALEKETESTYYDIDGRQDAVTTQKIYDYQFDWTDPGSSLKPRQIQTTKSDGTAVVDSMDYQLGYPAILSRHKHMENSSWKENRILFKPNSSLPDKVQSRTNQLPVFRDEIKYNAYDTYGNVTELMGKDGMPISFIWAYKGQFPVARIENATIQQVYGGTNVFEGWAAYDEPPFALWSKLELLRTELPQARITTFEYHPLQGMVSITEPNNLTTKFDYDHYSRLTGSYLLDVKSPTDIRKTMLQKYIYKLGK